MPARPHPGRPATDDLPIRIVHVITRLIVGGAQENTLASVLGLSTHPDFSVQLLSGPSQGPEGSLESQTVPHPGLLTVLPNLVRPIHPWHDARSLAALTRSFRRTQPHIVHTHSGKAGLLGRLAAHHTGVPRIVHTIHGPSFGPFQAAPANWAFRQAERFAGQRTDHFVVVAEAMRDQYLAAGIGQPDQYTRLFSGFNLHPFLHAQPDPDQRARLGLQPDDFVVGMIARLFKLKGHDDLLQTLPALARSIPNLRVLLVGDGAWRNRLEARATRLGVRERVVFAGLVPPDQIPAHVAHMNVLVHLSRREGLPRALPQALAAAKPVVAYDCDGAREVCRDEDTGFLLRPGDLEGLGRRLTQLHQDPALRRRLGERGQTWVSEHFPVERMVRDLEALYRRLLAQPPRRPLGTAAHI